MVKRIRGRVVVSVIEVIEDGVDILGALVLASSIKEKWLLVYIRLHWIVLD